MASSGIVTLILLLAAVIIGFITDYPTQKQKQRERDCEKDGHKFGEWKEEFELHNGNEYWKRKCEHCKEVQDTVSKITPYTPDTLYCFQCEIEMPTKFKNGLFYCKNCGLLHTNNYQ